MILIHAFNNPKVAYCAIAQYLERFAISRAAIGSDCLFQTWIFDDNDTFFQPVFKGHRSIAPSQDTRSKGGDRRKGELGVVGELLWIGNRAIGNHGIGFRHQMSSLVRDR